MLRSRPKTINARRSTGVEIEAIREVAVEAHALARALASEFCDCPAGTVPEWIEKLAALTERASRITVERLDALQERSTEREVTSSRS